MSQDIFYLPLSTDCRRIIVCQCRLIPLGFIHSLQNNFQLLRYTYNLKIYTIYIQILWYVFLFYNFFFFIFKHSKFLSQKKLGTFYYLASTNVKLQREGGAREQLSTRDHSCPMYSIQITVFIISLFKLDSFQYLSI